VSAEFYSTSGSYCSGLFCGSLCLCMAELVRNIMKSQIESSLFYLTTVGFSVNDAVGFWVATVGFSVSDAVGF
jgi:hypothetical protein